MRQPRIIRAVDLPEEHRCIGTLNAYEMESDGVLVACRLSDENYEVGQLAVVQIPAMGVTLAEIEYSVDQFFMAFHAVDSQHMLLVETGNVVHRRTASGWQDEVLDSGFLQEAYSLPGTADFVFGDNGDIFRNEGAAWSLDDNPAMSTILGMHGRTNGELFAVGNSGTVLKADGRQWENIDIGVGISVRCVHVAQDRNVYLAGDQGFAAVLQGSELTKLEADLEGDILSIDEFRGELYFCDSEFGLSKLVGGKLEPVANLGYVYRVNGGANWLTMAAGQNIFQFNGKTWRGVRIYFSDGYRTEQLDMSVLG